VIKKGSEIVDILKYAMQMEKDGEEYYRQLAQQTENKGLKSILTMLADEEVKHYKTIEQMKAEKPQPAPTKILARAKNIFAQIKKSDEGLNFGSGQIKLYKKAQDIEKRSEQFYREKANKVKEKYQKEIFLQLAEEENKHYFLLENIIQFVSRPQTWVENAEFHHLDEY
jgi:rubrerythrin